MAWQRSGDTGATYPKLMAARGDKSADERTINELAGFIWRLSMLSGAHLTDYVLDVGTVEMIGGPRTTELVRLAVRYRLLTKVTTDHGPSLKLIDDPDFIHLRSRHDVEWGRQQRADTRDLALIVPVRRRDGDNCRWCGFEVVWRGMKTKRSGEYDHLVPGEPGTVETMVVACRGCNSTRGGDVDRWDSEHTLRPVPAAPRYGRWTAELLSENGHPTEPNTSSERPAPAPGADTAPTRVRPATSLGDDPAAPVDRAQQSPKSAPGIESHSTPDSLRGSDRTSSVGSGRVGSGLGLSGSGSGLASDGSGPGGVSRRRRGSRGGRGRGSGGGRG